MSVALDEPDPNRDIADFRSLMSDTHLLQRYRKGLNVSEEDSRKGRKDLFDEVPLGQKGKSGVSKRSSLCPLYKENLKRDLPHIPLLLNQEGFEACVSVGKQLMDMHVNYEDEKVVEEYPLKHVSDRDIPYLQRLRVEKMKLSVDKTSLVVSQGLTLEGIPPECFEYRLGNRSALEWVIDQYQVSTDKRSGIESDPNRLDDPDYIVRLVKQVVAVSVKTVELVKELAEAVASEDWLLQYPASGSMKEL